MTARAICLSAILAITAADGCSTQQQQRVAFYQPVTPRFQQGPTADAPPAGPRRWEHGFTWSSSGSD